MDNKKWTPTQEDNLGIITSTYDFINDELSKLQEKTGCPDLFIYNFIGGIQNEWGPNSCHSVIRNKNKHR